MAADRAKAWGAGLKRLSAAVKVPEVPVRNDRLKSYAGQLARLVWRFNFAVDKALITYREPVMEMQLVQERIANAAMELFASTCVLSRWDSELSTRGSNGRDATDHFAADLFVRRSLRKTRHFLRDLGDNDDSAMLATADAVLGKSSADEPKRRLRHTSRPARAGPLLASKVRHGPRSIARSARQARPDFHRRLQRRDDDREGARAAFPPRSTSTDVEVLIIDDSSRDETFLNGLRYQQAHSAFKITVLRTPENQGYGGNQKLGYRYAIDNGFDIVALVHGDGQYAPEKLPALLAPLLAGKADAVFGSRMIDKRAARAGGMPLYKWIGNQILTSFQNRMLGTQLSEFHSGYRLYSTKALAQIPFEKNTNDFHFDTEIIIQFVLKKLRIAELPIPTYYGDEICHVNGMKYAWDICQDDAAGAIPPDESAFRSEVRRSSHREETYDLKLGFASSHTAAIRAARPGGHLLDIGCGQGYVAQELASKGCRVTGMDQYVPEVSVQPGQIDFIRWNLDRKEFPVNVSHSIRSSCSTSSSI